MAITVTQAPSALCFAGNIPDILLTTSDPGHDVTISMDGNDILEEYYVADADGKISITLKQLIEKQLSVHIPDADLYQQADAVADIVCDIDGTEVAFRAIKGGVDRKNLDTSNFLTLNWLTWQPQTKNVKYFDPEYLTYYAQAALSVKVKGYFQDGTDTTITAYTLPADQLTTVNVTFDKIHALFEEQPLYFDVWVDDGDDGENTWYQRYVLTDSFFEYNDLFVFENSLGAIDTIRFTGKKTLLNSQQFDSGLFFDEFEHEYEVNPDKAYEKNTGYFRSRKQLFWSQDFFSSLQKYHLDGTELKRILTREPSFEAAQYDLIAFDFTFVYTRQVIYLDWIEEQPSNVLVIVGPSQELYYLVPRMWLFPILEDPTGAIFPVQVTGEQDWYGLTFSTILEFLREELEIPTTDRIISPGTFVINSDISGTLTGASWVRNGVTYSYTGPVVLTTTPDDPDSRFDIIYTQPSSTVGYEDGEADEDPIIPNPPSGEMVLHEILRLNTGENIITPIDEEDPETKSQTGRQDQYSLIWRQTLQQNTYYDFKLSFVGWASSYTQFDARPLNGMLLVNFVTGASDTEIDPDRISIQTRDISTKSGDFVIVQTSSNQASIYVRKTAYFQTVTFNYLGVRTTSVKEDSFINNQGYSTLPAGDAYHSWNGKSYIPSTGNTVKFDKPRAYGLSGTPITGNLTIATAYADDSNMAKVLHNDSTEPTISVPAGVTKRLLSGEYFEDIDNFFLFIIDIDDSGDVKAINYTISQNDL
ncbi:hypothetical protein GCM10027284_08710 [Cyclobacterium sediminis]